MLRFFGSFFLLSFVLSLFGASFVEAVPQAGAFSMTISPAKEVFELRRGDEKQYRILFRNNASDDTYTARVVDFAYNSNGVRQYIEKKDLANPEQSLTNWVTLGASEFSPPEDVDFEIPVTIKVPEDAQYGDHFGVVLIEKKALEEGAGSVAVGGSIASVLAIKVLGGAPIHSGGLVDYFVETQERARNTANFFVKVNNTGNEFFDVLAEIQIFENKDDDKPIKQLTKDVTLFPNVVRDLKLPLGDLGDDYGEKEYIARLTVYEFDEGVRKKTMATKDLNFMYFVPIDSSLHAAAPAVIEKEVLVTPPLVAVVKELGLYIFAFLVALIVLIRVLFFHTVPAGPHKKRK